MFRRVVAAGTVLAALTGTVVLATPTSSGAQTPSPFTVSGNFYGDSRDEGMEYHPGTAQDYIFDFTPDPGGVVLAAELVTINGSYVPTVGNFDGDEWYEILWYAPGTAQDFVWNFTSATAHTSVPYTVNGRYQPVVGDYTGDGTDDILWYVPGTGQDYLWEYNADGGYSSTPRVVNGRYTPVVGSFGANDTDDILWYAPGAAGDFLWDYNVGTVAYVSRPYPVSGTFRPIVVDIEAEGWRGDDILWYAHGGQSHIWDFTLGVKGSSPWSFPGPGTPVVGDYLGDGHEDILWTTVATYDLWDFTSESAPPTYNFWLYQWGYAAAAMTASSAGEPVESGASAQQGAARGS